MTHQQKEFAVFASAAYAIGCLLIILFVIEQGWRAWICFTGAAAIFPIAIFWTVLCLTTRDATATTAKQNRHFLPVDAVAKPEGWRHYWAMNAFGDYSAVVCFSILWSTTHTYIRWIYLGCALLWFYLAILSTRRCLTTRKEKIVV